MFSWACHRAHSSEFRRIAYLFVLLLSHLYALSGLFTGLFWFANIELVFQLLYCNAKNVPVFCFF